MDRRVLGQDGDAALAFQLVRVHDALGDGLVGAEGAGLAQHGIDQGGLAMVDVGDDGDVADGGAHGRRFPLLFLNALKVSRSAAWLDIQAGQLDLGSLYSLPAIRQLLSTARQRRAPRLCSHL